MDAPVTGIEVPKWKCLQPLSACATNVQQVLPASSFAALFGKSAHRHESDEPPIPRVSVFKLRTRSRRAIDQTSSSADATLRTHL